MGRALGGWGAGRGAKPQDVRRAARNGAPSALPCPPPLSPPFGAASSPPLLPGGCLYWMARSQWRSISKQAPHRRFAGRRFLFDAFKTPRSRRRASTRRPWTWPWTTGTTRTLASTLTRFELAYKGAPGKAPKEASRIRGGWSSGQSSRGGKVKRRAARKGMGARWGLQPEWAAAADTHFDSGAPLPSWGPFLFVWRLFRHRKAGGGARNRLPRPQTVFVAPFKVGKTVG